MNGACGQIKNSDIIILIFIIYIDPYSDRKLSARRLRRLFYMGKCSTTTRVIVDIVQNGF
eukprot:COSAG01_NODE_5845_length_3999_cov_54.574872_3_plen_60_part_00